MGKPVVRGAGFLMFLAGGMAVSLLAEQGQPVDPLAGPPPKESIAYYRVIRSFGKVDLTGEQKQKVLQIQARTRGRIAEALYEERVQILGLLSDVQKIQLRDIEAMQAEKEREIARSRRNKPQTTQPPEPEEPGPKLD